jgi:hypothetical protein
MPLSIRAKQLERQKEPLVRLEELLDHVAPAPRHLFADHPITLMNAKTITTTTTASINFTAISYRIP